MAVKVLQKTIVILGTSRSDGETKRAVNIACADSVIEIVDLNDWSISPYDYTNKNRHDDFLRLVDKLLDCEQIMFATPVYWYAMSAQLKTFIDRLSDLITIEKSKGRALKGKNCYLIATGTDNALPEGFEVPFQRTCEYFDMRYHSVAYLYTGTNLDQRRETEESLKEWGKRLSL